MTHIDLFSGIGGFALAARWTGFRTEVFCEIDPFCQEVLKVRFGAVADAEGKGLERSIREGGARSGGRPPKYDDGPILIPDIFTFDGTRFRGTTLLTGGFPCQPFSVAGKRKGKEDDRHLWPEMLRVISEARPAWIIGENVTGIINMELEQVCLDLETEGYEVQPVVIPAVAVNAPHRRDRVWIIGHSGELGLPRIDGRRTREKSSDGYSSLADSRNGSGTRRTSKPRWKTERRVAFSGPNRHAPDAAARGWGQGTPNAGRPLKGAGPTGEWDGLDDIDWNTPWPEVAARLCRMDDGLPAWIYRRRTERLKALGNSIVPAVTYEIIKGIAEVERGKTA